MPPVTKAVRLKGGRISTSVSLDARTLQRLDKLAKESSRSNVVRGLINLAYSPLPPRAKKAADNA